MSKRTEIQSRSANCPRCGPITYKCSVSIHSTDEVADIESSVDQILDYGNCQVAKEAGGHPVYSQLKDCPVFKE